MAAPSLTYTLTNNSTADATQVMQNFNDLLNGYTDGSKDLSISALTCAGTATFNGAVNLGNATGDDITVTGSLASSIPIKTTNTYDIGSSTLLLAKVYATNLYSAAGAVGAPVYTFHADTDTGLYRVGADNLGITTAGTLRFDVSTTAVTSTLPYIAPTGSVSAPSYSFASDTNTGLWRVSADNVGIAVAGADYFRVSGTATYQVGITDTDGTFDTASTSALSVYGQSGASFNNRSSAAGARDQILFYDAAGDTNGSITSDSSANTTAYNTSSDARLKHLYEDFNASAMIDRMQPLQYERLLKPGVKEFGFVAQQLHEVLPQAVVVGGNSPLHQPWQVDYGQLTGVLCKAIKELRAEIEELKSGKKPELVPLTLPEQRCISLDEVEEHREQRKKDLEEIRQQKSMKL